MRFRFAVGGGIAKDGNMRRMLLRNNESKADIAEFEKRPSGVLIDDVALEVRCVPFHGLGNVAHTDGNVIERIEDGSAF